MKLFYATIQTFYQENTKLFLNNENTRSDILIVQYYEARSTRYQWQEQNDNVQMTLNLV